MSDILALERVVHLESRNQSILHDETEFVRFGEVRESPMLDKKVPWERSDEFTEPMSFTGEFDGEKRQAAFTRVPLMLIVSASLVETLTFVF